MAGSVTSDKDGFPAHIALPDAPPGTVEIWEPLEPDDRTAIEGWQAPFDVVSETSPRVKLAQRIARTVRKLIDNREPVGIERRAARYGDILVLVRQRGELFEAVIRALKQEHVEVAGADRMVLTEHIAVMDLMVLADALLLPEDDLALATCCAVRCSASRMRIYTTSHGVANRCRFGRRSPQIRREILGGGGAARYACARMRGARRRLRFTRSSSAPAARGGVSWRGLGTRPTMRSTSFSISRSTTSGARRRRCKALLPGCAKRAPR